MKNRSAQLIYFILAGVLLNAQITRAQEPSTGDPSNESVGAKCRIPVTITGAVRAPSSVELRRRLRLMELLAFAGGLTERAGKTVEITRAALGSDCERPTPDNPSKKPGSVEVYALAEVLRDSDNANPYLQPGDSVIVPELSVAYVTGNVAQPRAILFDMPITLTQAINMAGGILPDSLNDRVSLIRDCRIVTLDLKAIKKRRAEDVLIQPYDIIEVPRKGQHGGRLLCQKINPSVIELPLRVIY